MIINFRFLLDGQVRTSKRSLLIVHFGSCKIIVHFRLDLRIRPSSFMHHGQFWSILAYIYLFFTQNIKKNWLKESKNDQNWAVEEVRPVQDGFDITIANIISSKILNLSRDRLITWCSVTWSIQKYLLIPNIFCQNKIHGVDYFRIRIEITFWVKTSFETTTPFTPWILQGINLEIYYAINHMIS